MIIVVTGGCGFVSSSIALSLREPDPCYRLIPFDNSHRGGSKLNLHRILKKGVEFTHGDIRIIIKDSKAFERADVIIEASAEPSVLTAGSRRQITRSSQIFSERLPH